MYNIVTSFNKQGLETYALKMLEAAARHWKGGLKLTAYYHDFDIDKHEVPRPDHIEYRNLNLVPEMIAFRETFADHDGTEKGKVDYNFRLDAIKFCHKVYALTDFAFELADQSRNPGWLIWLDADTYTKKDFHFKDLEKILNDKAELSFLGRKHFEYSETSFMGFNLKYRAPLDLLGDLRGVYDAGEILNYREWHDGFIFERLLIIYRAHGMRVQDFTGHLEIKDMLKGKQAFESFPLSEYMEHLKGDRKDKGHLQTFKPKRYKLLSHIIRQYQPARVVETGTWIGQRAIEMALTSFESRDDFHYIGYDLFEDGTDELNVKELNAKSRVMIKDIRKHLNAFKRKMKKKKNKTFTFELIKGDTNQTLNKNVQADLAFIDGGHSKHTVRNDYDKLKHIPIIVLDDFFSEDERGDCLDEEFLEVNRIVNGTKHRKYILPSNDPVKEGGITHLAVILTSDDVEGLTTKVMQVPIQVTPRDCVPDGNIIGNVKKNLNLMSNWLQRGRAHGDTAIIVSGGDSTDWDLVRGVSRAWENTRIVCVKHSYPTLLENGIQPWGCVILDPRPLSGKSTHGIIRRTLFEHVDKQTIFFLASMTNPSVTRLLKKQDAQLWGWHAFSETLRQQTEKNKPVQNNTIHITENLAIPHDTTFITGGTCAAMRSVGLMHTIGFRNFHLFGFDCTIPEPSEKNKRKKEKDGRPKFLNVTVEDNKFWTTGELLAMAQDCEKLFERDDVEMNLEVYGENTLVKALWNKSRMDRVKNYTTFLPC